MASSFTIVNKAYLGFLPFYTLQRADEGAGCTIGEFLTIVSPQEYTMSAYTWHWTRYYRLRKYVCPLVNNLPLIMDALTGFTRIKTFSSFSHDQTVSLHRHHHYQLGSFAIASCRLIFSFQGFF